jgi:hypothetical protein
MRRQRVTAAVVAASPVAESLARSYALLLIWESMSRTRVRIVCLATGVFVVRDINVMYSRRDFLEGVLEIVEPRASLS